MIYEYDATGKISASFCDSYIGQHTGQTLTTQAPVDIASHRVANGQIVPLPERPSQHHQFNYQTGEWMDTRDTAFYEAEARAKRLQLLSASDWTQLPDVPMTTKEAWATYRQALRDITEQAGFPLNIVWPAPPD